MTASPHPDRPLSLYTGTRHVPKTTFTEDEVREIIADLALDGDPLAHVLRYMANTVWGGPAGDGY